MRFSAWDEIKADIRRNARNLLWFWLVGAAVIFLGFIVYWTVVGWPRGPDGIPRTVLEFLVIALVVPPVLWLIRKVAF